MLHNRSTMKIKLLCRSVLCLFGTFLHELSHFAVAMLLGKSEGFSIVPRIDGDSFIFGEVKARVRFRILAVFIACAPLIWWALLLIIVKHVLSDFSGPDVQRPSVTVFLEKLKTFSLRDVFLLWFASQLLWAGRLSTQDIKTCFRGIISPSGLFLIGTAVLLVQILRHVR